MGRDDGCAKGRRPCGGAACDSATTAGNSPGAWNLPGGGSALHDRVRLLRTTPARDRGHVQPAPAADEGCDLISIGRPAMGVRARHLPLDGGRGGKDLLGIDHVELVLRRMDREPGGVVLL